MAAVALLAVGTVFGPASGTVAAATTELTWSAPSSPIGPPALTDPAMAYDPDTGTVVLFGGQTANGTLSDETWLWNGSAWSQAANGLTGADGPPARRGASMAFDSTHHAFVLFGGIGSDGAALDDTWAWNGASWIDETASAGIPPPPRYDASMAPDAAGDLVLFGGTATPTTATPPPTTSTTGTTAPAGSPTVLGDTWTYNGSVWTAATTSPVTPPARTAASMAFDPVHDQTVLFGGSPDPAGTSPSSTPLADTWTWNGAAWTQAAPTTSPPARSGAALVGDPAVDGALLTGGTGSGGTGSGGTGTATGSAGSGDTGQGAGSAGSGSAGSGAVGGGSTGSAGTGLLSDAWAWDGATWTPALTAGTPPARTAAGSAYDSGVSGALFYGGTGTTGAPLATTTLLAEESPPLRGSTTTTTVVRHGSGIGSAPRPTPRSVPVVETPTAVPSSRQPTSRAPSTTAPGPARTPTTPPGAQPRSTPVAAAQPTQPGPAPEVVHDGTKVVLYGYGFRPGAVVTITFHSVPQRIGSVDANAEGTASATVTVPDGAAPGDHHFEMLGPSPSGTMTMVLTAVVVLAGGAVGGHSLGLTTPVLVTVAVLLPIATWIGLGMWGRRRRHPVPT